MKQRLRKKKLKKQGLWWYGANNYTAKAFCPCCDYLSLPQNGNYNICPICFWEDDGISIDSENSYSGPNHMSIFEGRENFIKYGACEERCLKFVLDTSKLTIFKHKSEKL